MTSIQKSYHFQADLEDDNDNNKKSSAEEEWVTKKKVEITTTKNVETKVYRQLVLEDGRVIDEEVPTITIDRTEDKQIFETDHDEDRDIMNNSASYDKAVIGSSATDNNRHNNIHGDEVHLGDKFTTVKTVKEIKENVRKTEAVQNIGNIRSREVMDALADKENIGKYIRVDDTKQRQIVTPPKTVFQSRNHHIVTDKEDVQEKKWMSGGKVKNERIVTEEHVEYDSDDSACSSSSSESSRSTFVKQEPEEYKTRTEEAYTEYFVKGKKRNGEQNMVKVGDGPRYKSESRHLKNEKGRMMPQTVHQHRQLTQVRSLDGVERNNRHGLKVLSSSTSDLSQFGSLDRGRTRKTSKSSCDVRVDNDGERVYIAKVIEPEVKMRKKKTDLRYYSQELNSDYKDQPVRPPRAKEYTFPNCRIADSHKERLKPARPHSVDFSDTSFFKNGSTSSSASAFYNHSPAVKQELLGRNFSSTQSLEEGSQQMRSSRRPTKTEQTTVTKSTYHLFPTLRRERNYHSTQNLSERSSSYSTMERPRSVNFSLEEPIKVKSNYKLFPSSQLQKSSQSHHQSTGNIYNHQSSYSTSNKGISEKDKAKPLHLSVGDVSSEWRSSSGEKMVKKERKSSGQLIFSSEKPSKVATTKLFPTPTPSKTVTSSYEKIPLIKDRARIIPIEIYSNSAPVSPLGSPSTKYRTRVVVNGAA